MIIKQCKMLNRSQKNIFSYFLKKHSLKRYTDPKKPALFYSLWSYGRLAKHESFGLIIWRGSDIIRERMVKRLNKIAKRKNIYHVAISSYIADDLKKYGIKYKFIPIVGVDMTRFEPCLMGNEIYTYIPEVKRNKYHKKYGGDIIKKIKKKCKYKINIIESDQYRRRKLIEVYKKCFCGFRFTSHDGLPSQVIEMGLMGRRSFYNGNIPGSIKWDKKNIDNILENIEKESKKIGTIDYEYSNRIRSFINVGTDWLDTSFWTKSSKWR